MDEIISNLRQDHIDFKILIRCTLFVFRRLLMRFALFTAIFFGPVSITVFYLPETLFSPVIIQLITTITGVFAFVFSGLMTEVALHDHTLSLLVGLRTSYDRFKKAFRMLSSFILIVLLLTSPAWFIPILSAFLPGLGLVYSLLTVASLGIGFFFLINGIFLPLACTLRQHTGRAAWQFSLKLSHGYRLKIIAATMITAVFIGLLISVLTLPLILLTGELIRGIALKLLTHFGSMFLGTVIAVMFFHRDCMLNGFVEDRYSTLIAMDAAHTSKMQSAKKSSAQAPTNKVNFLDRFIKSEKLRENLNKIFQDKDEKTLNDLLELERETPTDQRVKIKIGEMLYKKNLAEEAIEKLQAVATSFEGEEFYLKAIDVYKKILRIKPDFVPVNLKLADLYLKLKMTTESANQLRIAINYHAQQGDLQHTRELAEKLVGMDPSLENYIKLAEIYQSCGMTGDAVVLYEIIAREYRNQKNYEKLLHFYELIMPHRPDNMPVLKDICILHLKHKNPQRAMFFMEQYKVKDNTNFKELLDKATLMLEALRRQKSRKMA